MTHPYDITWHPHYYVGDVLLKSVKQLNLLVEPGSYGVTSPVAINGSAAFNLQVIPVKDVPGDFFQVQKAFDAAYPNVFVRKCTTGVFSAWLNEYTSVVQPFIDASIEEHRLAGLPLRNILTRTITGTEPTSHIPEGEGAVVGTNVIPANSWVELGSQYRMRSKSSMSTGTGSTGAISVVLGPESFASPAIALPNTLVNMIAFVDMTLTLVTPTTVRLSGFTMLQTAVGQTTPIFRGLMPAVDFTFDPTVDNAIDLLYTFTGTDNSLVVREISIQKL